MIWSRSGQSRLERQVDICNRLVRLLLDDALPNGTEPGEVVPPPREVPLSILDMTLAVDLLREVRSRRPLRPCVDASKPSSCEWFTERLHLGGGA